MGPPTDTDLALLQLAAVLEITNTTLEVVELNTETTTITQLERDIEYHAELNLFGRARTRDPNTAKAEFVQLLVAAMEQVPNTRGARSPSVSV